MGQYDKLNARAGGTSDLEAMAEALETTALLESATIDELRRTIDSKMQIATIAKEMGKQLDRVSDELAAMQRELREMRSSVEEGLFNHFKAK